jgi:hypothetical protein
VRAGGCQQFRITILDSRSSLFYLRVFLGRQSADEIRTSPLGKIGPCEGGQSRKISILLFGEEHLAECLFVIENFPQVLVGTKGWNEQTSHFFRIYLKFKGLLFLYATHDGLLLLLVDLLDFTTKLFKPAAVGLILDGSDGLLGGCCDALLD